MIYENVCALPAVRDATTKSAEGTLAGNIYQLGDFAECIETRAPFTTQYCLATVKAHPIAFQTHPSSRHYRYPATNNYSTVLERFTVRRIIVKKTYNNIYNIFKVPGDRSREPKNYIKAAWCVPASCSVTDLEEALTVHFKNVKTSLSSLGITYSATVSEKECQINEPWNLDSLDVAFW